LTERAGVVPAPYLARAKWVALETKDALRDEELSSLLRESYDLVVAKLTKREREAMFHDGTRAKNRQARSQQRQPRRRRR
jgi:predicted DNA-binding protein (MmcQ/YjbR family)